MHFDKLCQTVESLRTKHPQKESFDMFDTMKRVALFSVPKTVTEICDESSADLWRSQTFLPFPEIALEDEMSVVFLREANELEVAAMHASITTEIAKQMEGGEMLPPLRFAFSMFNEKGGMMLGGACLPYLSPEARILANGSRSILGFAITVLALTVTDKRGNPTYFTAFSIKDQVQNPLLIEYRMQLMVESVKQVQIAMTQLQSINAPSNWVVRRENVKARPIPKGRIPRSDQRPRYIVVSNDDIHRVIRDPNPENAGTVKPHRRRAHSKLLKSEKFTWKRGQRVFVKACWVGPEQAEYGGERYKVCLDL